jgi:hypothetical protein
MKNSQQQNDKLLLQTQINCLSLEKTTNSLDYGFAPAMQPMTMGNSTIDVHNRKQMEQCKITEDKEFNEQAYKWVVEPIRLCQPSKGIQSDKKTYKNNYLKLSYADGHIPTCGIDIDSDLTRSNLEPRPADNLAERLTTGRMSVLPKESDEKAGFELDKIQIGARSIPNPRIIALFPNRGGLSTRDCKRKSSEYYKTNCNGKVCDQLGSHGRFN